MFKPQRLTFEELSERLREYERKYGYSTTDRLAPADQPTLSQILAEVESGLGQQINNG
jgi:hypothetical protein